MGRFAFLSLGTREGGKCDDDLPGKQCVAGAECVNSTCRCLSGVAVRSGVLCGRHWHALLLLRTVTLS